MNYNRKETKESILEVYECCEIPHIRAGIEWYDIAHQLVLGIALKHGKSFKNVVGVMAALSPMSSWDYNLILTDLFLSGIYKHTGKQTDKASRIMQCVLEEDIVEILSGRKTSSFFYNILHPESDAHVTIDRHSLAVAGHDERTCTKKQYDFFASCYKEVAEDCKIKAHHLQASTWVYWRECKSKKS